jgi:hypothetical protein
MAWEPDPELRQLLDLQMTDIREPKLVRLQREEWRRIENQFAARGVMGGGLIAACRDAAQRALEEMADEFIGTILPRIVEFSGGRLPAGADDWVRSYFETLERTAIALGRTLMERPTVRNLPTKDALVRSVEGQLTGAVAARKRRLEIQLRTLNLSQRLRQRAAAPVPRPEGAYDVFISYATEDGADVARPLATELERRGFRVWIDQSALRVGDSLMDTIDRALSESRFGVVVLSPGFLARRWPRRELNALATIADEENRKVILPIWHGVDRAALMAAGAVFLADLFAANSNEGIARLADAIERELRDEE